VLGLRLRPTVRQGQVHLAQPRDPPQPVYQREQIFVPIALAQDQLRVFYRTELATSKLSKIFAKPLTPDAT
jgi:hypothetical protein